MKTANKWTVFLTCLVLVAIVVIVVIVMCRQVEKYKSQNDPVLNELRSSVIAKLAPHYPTLNNISVYASDRSETINKQHVYLCMKDKNGKYYDKNSLTYVLLHELAHVLCNEVNQKDPHTQKWQHIFESLKMHAHKLGIYDNTKPMVKNYCGYD
jgi:hypothetical protein